MMEKNGDFDFKRQLAKFKEFKRTAPLIIAEESVNHFLLGFRKGGGQTDKSAGGWKPRKVRSAREAQRSNGRAILVRSGNMRSDIKARKIGFDKIVINVIHIPYAAYHNDGAGALPQREFIGESKILTAKNKRILEQELKKLNQ